MFKFLSAAGAALMFAMPSMAQTIHDFDGTSVPTPSNSSRQTREGNCFTSKDNSRICYFRLTNQTYSLAISDVDFPQYPLAVVVECNSGQYRSWGTVPPDTVKLWATTFCRDGRY